MTIAAAILGTQLEETLVDLRDREARARLERLGSTSKIPETWFARIQELPAWKQTEPLPIG